MSELEFFTIAEAAQLLQSRRLSPVELTKHVLSRIEVLDPIYNAFLEITAEVALGQARIAEAEISAGRYRGPMHGIPYGLKDLIDVAGLRTTCHSKILADNVASQDASVVTRLREAGAILVGKLALHEFGSGGPTFDLPWPPARNPWNEALHPPRSPLCLYRPGSRSWLSSSSRAEPSNERPQLEGSGHGVGAVPIGLSNATLAGADNCSITPTYADLPSGPHRATMASRPS